jgi:ABC-2 type transport system ATP-binding protein
MNQNEVAVAVTSLRKSFKKHQVLKGVNFTVRKGQVFALLGSNGAGKTTAVKILSTLIKPDEGNCVIHGFNVAKEARRVREHISLTGQYAAVDENLTGRENLLMIAALRHLRGARKQADELLARFELSQAADRRVAVYSGGMRRKLDLAMSLVGNPAVIFLDEPTTGLDPQSRLAMWKIVKSLSESGTTIFLTTQYLEEAERLADYIAILNNGVIAAEGTADELKAMTSGSVIEFSFYEETEMQKAANLLDNYKVRADSETLVLSVAVNDSVEQLADILNLLKSGGATVSRFEQKLPTLEDVFLTLIGKQPEKKEGEKND